MAGILGLTALRLPQVARFWLPALLLFSLVAWAFASKKWSIDPGTTQRRAIALFATTLLGVYLAAHCDGRQLAEICALTFLVLAVGS
jgi:exopolysaccharide production protein ExoQ